MSDTPLYSSVRASDPEAASLLDAEDAAQRLTLELIPSENYTSMAVRDALGSSFTNVYSEGYPGKRYYGGQKHVDAVERLAIARAKALFGEAHVNVQPYSGSSANIATLFALLAPGDPILAMKLDQGGHITHGLSVSFTGKTYAVSSYGVDPESERIDMEAVARLARETKPKLILAGFSAYPRDLDWAAFRAIADEVGALLMGDVAHIAGLIAGGALENPLPLLDVMTFTTHKTLRGPRGGMIMAKPEHAAAIDRAVFPGFQGGPHDHVTAAKAVAFGEAATPAFRDYAAAVIGNARMLAETLIERGHRLVSGGTDNHLLLLDVARLGLGGEEASQLLESVGLIANKNKIPYDPRPATDPSGIRLGTPALTTRGMGAAEMEAIGGLIDDLLRAPADDAVRTRVADATRALAEAFPPPR